MSKKLSQNITYWLGVVAIGLVVGLSLQFVRAWTEPAVAPPGGNVGAPINTGDNSQWKLGNLALNTNGTYVNGLIVANGNVGIGTANPTEKFQVCIGISCASVKEDIMIANYGYDIYEPWVYPGGLCSNVYPQETCDPDPAVGGFASYTCDVNTNKNCVDTITNAYEGGKCPSGTGCCKRNIDCKIEGEKVIKWVDSPGVASVITD